VGLLTTLPMLGAAFGQLAAPRLAHLVGARCFVVSAALVQALCFVPLGALALGSGNRYLPRLAGVTLYWLLALGINPVWNAWMGRLVPAYLRGRFFGRRNAAVNAALLCSARRWRAVRCSRPAPASPAAPGWASSPASPSPPSVAWRGPGSSRVSTIRRRGRNRPGRRCWAPCAVSPVVRSDASSRCWYW